MPAAKKPVRRSRVKRVAPKAADPKAIDPTVTQPVVHAGPVAVHVAAVAAAPATVFVYPRAPPLASTVATGVAASRVRLGVHFPSDAAGGGVIGIGIGTFSAWLVKKRG